MIALFVLNPLFFAFATPPEYATYGRAQTLDHQPDARNIMRIWIAYVGQGDGILIQLPPRCNYPMPDQSGTFEPVDILIDGGSFDGEDKTRMRDLLLDLYDEPIIEHAVISHHDMDHVVGLMAILESNQIAVESLYHNGLASYAPGALCFKDDTSDQDAVLDRRDGKLVRAMAALCEDPDGAGRVLKDAYLINNLDELKLRKGKKNFQGVYDNLARTIIQKADPAPVTAFQRCFDQGSFINEREAELSRGVDLDGINFELLWPMESPRKYGDWGETINGNSVTFRLDYGDFSMFFSGDHNEKSEEKFLKHGKEPDRALEVDVLKVPHHGSSHAYQSFFQRQDSSGKWWPRAVVSVASMGSQGFDTNWKHPSEDVVQWLGGAHRVFHTFVHERRFVRKELKTAARRKTYHEMSHVLIETDGEWFRIVEVDVEEGAPNSPPLVQETRRGNGTRWIRAK